MTVTTTVDQQVARRHYDTISQDIPGFTFPNGLPKEMNPLKSRPKCKGIPETTGERVAKRPYLINEGGSEWG